MSHVLLTREEETELLNRAMELRRIHEVEGTIPRSSRAVYPKASLAREAGYETVTELQEALDVGELARDELVMKNMRLVHHVVRKVMSSRSVNSLTVEDLVQEGTIGLVRAVEKYNPTKKNGGRFSTYATYWIRAAVLRMVAEKDDLIRAPEHVTFAINKIRDAARSLGIDLTEFTSKVAWQEAIAARKLAEASGLSTEQFEHAIRVAGRRSGGGYVQMQVYHDPGFKGVVDEPSTSGVYGEDSDNQKLIEVFSSYLKPKEMEVLGLRYGIQTSATSQSKPFRDYEAEAEKYLFDNSPELPIEQPKQVKAGKYGEAMSFQEVGKRVGVSAEYCRRLCGAALKKLRQAAEDGQLDPVFLGA